jgi:adenylate cyclase class 2
MSKGLGFGNDDVAERDAMDWEVEQKFRVETQRSVEARLAEFNVKLAAAVEQIDRYFNHPGRDFRHTDEALRLRQVGEDNFITYKGPKIDPTTKTRCEVELPLPSGLSVSAQFTNLLVKLGFQAAGIVKKTRRSGEMDWEGHKVEVAVDEVEGLGRFVELEIAASDNTLDSAKAALESLSRRLDLGQTERRSYLAMLLELHS